MSLSVGCPATLPGATVMPLFLLFVFVVVGCCWMLLDVVG